MPKETIYLIDGTSICYRSFFAIKLATSAGFPTGAIYGFFQTLKKLTDKYNPVYMGICFDVSRKTFRQEKFKEYKIQRPPLPDALKAQIPIIKKLIDLMGITLVEKEGFEADDIITTITNAAKKKGNPTVIVTSDKDMYQLLDKDKVTIYNPGTDKMINDDDFEKEFGFVPSLIVDYLSLAGDSSDNIPGARGIGKVGATKLIKRFKTIENIFKSIEDIEPKLKQLLKENKNNVFLSKELVKLYSPDLKIDLKDLKVKEPDNAQLLQLFRELEFKKLLKGLSTPSQELKSKVKDNIPKETLQRLIKKDFVFFSHNDEIYVFDEEKECTYKVSAKDLKSILEDEKIRKISYDFKNQIISLKEQAIDLKGVWFDIGIAAYLADSSLVDYSLEGLSSAYLDSFQEEILPQDAPNFIAKLYEVLSLKLKAEKLEDLFFEIEMPLIRVLAHMQMWGVKIDIAVLESLLKEAKKRLKSAEKEIFKIAGKQFNLNSPKQLRVVLFEDLKIPPLKKTKTGYSTGEEVLAKLAPDYPIAKLLLNYRYLNKLTTTYINPLIDQVKEQKGFLHAQFNQTGAQTGRITSSSPNLQSIPTKGEFSSHLRRAFTSSFKDGYILSADYSQIELRILAHFSQDSNLMEAFNKDLDIHQFTASLLFGVKEKDVDDTQRNIAKRVNFGIVYGMSAFGLSKELNIGVDEAQQFIDSYFLRYPKVKNFISKINKELEKEGAVKTILGRRRNLPDFNSPNPHIREFARRQAVNAPIQGSCADLIKVAMVKIYNDFKEKNLKARIIIQIHDELIFDIPKDELEEVSKIVKKSMKESIALRVPIEVNIEAGKNWADLEEKS